MSTVTIDQSTQALFQDLGEVTELRNRQGVLVGYFTPAGVQEDDLYAKAFAKLDPDEIKRRKARNAGHAGYAIEQVLVQLQGSEK